MKFTTLGIIVLLLCAGCAENEALNQKNIRVSTAESDAAEPAIAAKDNQIFVAWTEHGADKGANVFLQKFDAGGKPDGEKTPVNPTDGAATAWRGDPPTIAIGEDNAIYIGWTRRVMGDDNHSADIMLSVSTDNGKSFAQPVKVNDDKMPAVHGMHSLAVDKSGKVYLAWLDERYLAKNTAETQNGVSSISFHHEKVPDEKPHDEKSPDAKPAEVKPMQHSEAAREVYFAVSADGGKTFAANKKLASNVCPCCKTALLIAPDKRIYAAWRQVLAGDFRHIAVASSDDGGESFGAATIVSDDHWQIAGCPVSGASLASGANGALEVLWFTAGASGTTGIYRAASIDGGKTFAPRQLVSPGITFGTPILLANARQNLSAVWGVNNKILIANLIDNQPAQELTIGELPSAAVVPAENRVAIAFVKSEAGKRAVWLSFANQ